MQLLHVSRSDSAGHRLHTLPLARPQEAPQVHRRPAALGLMPEGTQERLHPPLEQTVPRRPATLSDDADLLRRRPDPAPHLSRLLLAES